MLQERSNAYAEESINACMEGDEVDFMDWETRKEQIPMWKHIIAGKLLILL